MSKGDILTCYCGAEFEATNNRQKYCSTLCAQRFLQKRWRDENADHVRVSRKAWRDANQDKVREQKRRSRDKARGGPPRAKKERTRPVTERMPASTWDAKRYYLDKQLNDRLVRTYGITLDDFERMLDDQGGVCAICKKPETQMVRKKTVRRLCVDHNKRTGQVRALLCAQCNLAIGNSQEDPAWYEAAAEYIRLWNTEGPPGGG